MSHAPTSQVSQWAHEALRLVGVSASPETEPLAACRRGDVTLFFIGSAYNVAELSREQLGREAGDGGQEPASSLIELYLRAGCEPFSRLNGAFVLGVWDGRSAELHLMTDRLGLHKLYYAAPGRALLFASELKALLAHPEVSRAVDFTALGHFLSVGYVLDERTLYTAIRLLRGGTLLTYSPVSGRIATRPYWTPRCRTTGSPPPFEESVLQTAQHIQTALARRLEGVQRIGIPLSGGLDSRMLLGFTRRLRPDGDLLTVTVGHRHTYDMVFARRMAHICGTRHHAVPLEEDYIARRGAQFVWLTDGMVNVHHSWNFGASSLCAQECDRVFIGFLGAVLKGDGRGSKLISAETMEELVPLVLRRHLNVFSDEALASVLRPPVAREAVGAAARDYARCVREAQADELADAGLLANLQQRQTRMVSYFFSTLGAAVPLSAPFTDNNLVDFLLSLPPACRREEALYLAMIRRCLPELAQVGWEANGLPLLAEGWRAACQRRWRRFWKDELPRWSHGLYRPHDRRAYAHYGQWMRRPSMRAYLRETLTRGEPILAQWCDVALVRRMLERHLAGSVDAYRQLSALVTLILWFEQSQRCEPAGAMPEMMAAEPVLGGLER
jgi:asparagine synthetase B (glutamine-hydrolysing)